MTIVRVVDERLGVGKVLLDLAGGKIGGKHRADRYTVREMIAYAAAETGSLGKLRGRHLLGDGSAWPIRLKRQSVEMKETRMKFRVASQCSDTGER
jgi:hypothetical protein